MSTCPPGGGARKRGERSAPPFCHAWWCNMPPTNRAMSLRERALLGGEAWPMWCRPFLWPGQEEAPVPGGGRGFGSLIGGNLSDGREDHHLPSNIIPLSRETTAQGEHA